MLSGLLVCRIGRGQKTLRTENPSHQELVSQEGKEALDAGDGAVALGVFMERIPA